MRPRLARTPPGLERGSRSRHADEQYCTTRRSNTHRTVIAEERKVLYRWHPWAGWVVQIHEAVEKVSGTVLRCSPIDASERWLELPAWMFDRATCMAMRITPNPVVEFAALAALQELLAAATRQGDAALSSDTPVSSPARKARNQNRGMDDAPPSETSSATRAVRRAAADDRRSASSSLASPAGRDEARADGTNVEAPARPLQRRTASVRGGGR